MEQKLHNAFYLTAEEFLVLCALSGMTEVEGVFRRSPKEDSRQEIYYALHHLIQRKIVNEKKELQEPFLGMFSVIRKSKDVWMTFRREQRGISSCCYIGEYVVLSEVSEVDDNSIRLTRLEQEEYLQWLEDAEYLPPTELTEIEKKPLDKEKEKQILLTEDLVQSSDLERACPVPEVFRIVQRYRLKEKKADLRLFWLAESDRDYMIVQAEGASGSFEYNQSEVRQLLKKHMSGDQN